MGKIQRHGSAWEMERPGWVCWRSGEAAEALPAEKGTYVLVLRCERKGTVRVGRLGRMALEAGWYVYCGSAHGPGGLRARLAHHLRASEKLHWHMDYLKRRARIEAIWFCAGGDECECAAWLEKKRGLRVAMPGFGSSDCACEAHLFWAEG